MTPEEVLKKRNFIGHLAMKEYGIHCRIQERKTHIYVLEQDLLDNGPEGEGIYRDDYQKCMQDEIENHKTVVQDLEKELENLKQIL